MLNRFIALKAEEKKKPKERHHFLASECRDLAVAKKWDQQIMREISHKVTEIQNDGLEEHRLCDINDEINKLIRENGHGPGYRYFKAAKKLPGVKKLFEKQPELRKRRTTDDIYKSIDASYYGYRDEVLARVKGPTEAKMRTEAEEEWQRVLFEEEEDVVVEEMREREDKEREFFVHVPLPDDKEIERMIVERKKIELLSKYASEGLLEEQSEAMDILNIYS
ncbi:hypothetical protein E1A91_D03G141300v1 [Gossypium mustelinum]|uniref:Pre-mRNA-splicing factor ISY1-like protein n=1 Tax=Gossypium mustelinum TaxID=34275 RepID=A0A5D2VMJ7_GOSMU|nr:hypothetical protein E1A91_D03G141300v1 [Gossypium mustelinum]